MDLNNEYGTLLAQEKLLDLLKDFHSFCKRNQIKYSLAYGSLLGAIRHGGFIPWDDDLDVFVDRANYNLLIEHLLKDEGLTVDLYNVDSLWVNRVRRKKDVEGYSQGYRPTLDILVLDHVPNISFVRKFKLFAILMLQGMMKPHPSFHKGSLALRCCTVVTFLLGRLVPNKWKHKCYQKVSMIGGKSGLLANYNGEYADLRRTYPATMMDNVVEHSFEDTKAMIVADYDMCLTTQFGDYMTPPKESDRRPQHGA